MFDYGLDFQGVMKNIELLRIDITRLEALGLSHGHFDHFGNLVPFLKENKAKIKKGIPL
jgi:7,8-dihydropterin-6-yl-methyl-4-(beta-D-ribofuranosyl)aminobenzene 5'-phosphate synthase